jgi:hypothetical protein
MVFCRQLVLTCGGMRYNVIIKFPGRCARRYLYSGVGTFGTGMCTWRPYGKA